MKYTGISRLFGLLAVALACVQTVAAETKRLSYADLIHRLTDLERLAVLPEPGEGCAQCSSYDRASKYDEKTGKYVAWDANGDGGGIVRVEGDTLVLGEMKGPGCIWRIWSAAPGEGRVMLYLDDAKEPSVSLPFRGYFDHKNPPFTGKALVHVAASGWNCYVPIPYQKSCKVVAEKKWGNYYHFTYGTFPEGTQVPTFQRDLPAEDLAELDKADRVLAACGQDPAGPRQGETTDKKTVQAAAGQTVKVLELAGPQAITGLRVRLDLPAAPGDMNVLRELALRITFDGEAEPQVWSPLGDFFGTAAGAHQYRSLPLGLTEDGTWYSYWYMPLARSATIELANDGTTAREVSFEVVHSPLQRPLEQLGRFHAKWHRDALLPIEKERWIDWPMLKTEGRGRWLGVMLHVFNPKGGWWGEGDEKFFVDGEKFPSTFGTGSEDYFGYAWGSPALFQNCYHNQTISMNNRGHISVNRWHITDNVPFQKGFEGCIEKYFPNKRPTLFAATAYWYLAPGGKDPYAPLPVAERVGYPEVQCYQIKGALEGERMKVLSKTGGIAREQEMSAFDGQWSQGSHLLWTRAKPGDRLELALPVQEAGRYKLVAAMTKARDYGIGQLSLDGKKLGDPIDFFNPAVIPTGPIDLGVVELSAGEHKFAIEITGANEKAVKAHMIGLDYLKLERVP